MLGIPDFKLGGCILVYINSLYSLDEEQRKDQKKHHAAQLRLHKFFSIVLFFCSKMSTVMRTRYELSAALVFLTFSHQKRDPLSLLSYSISS